MGSAPSLAESSNSKISRGGGLGGAISRNVDQPSTVQAPKEEEKKDDEFIQVKPETRFQR